MTKVYVPSETADVELALAFAKLNEEGLIVVEHQCMFGHGDNGLSLTWKDIDMPCVIVRLKDFCSREVALRHLLNAYRGNPTIVANVREQQIDAVTEESKHAVKH